LINFNAEYDALPDIGHACGHNLISTSSIAAFLALSFVLKKYGIPGRAQLLGTPAEENGGGKAKLIDAGAYKGVDISLMAYVLTSDKHWNSRVLIVYKVILVPRKSTRTRRRVTESLAL
jgi:metal-dependent amidase/aminoacylase/carboxypeptidase family protein